MSSVSTESRLVIDEKAPGNAFVQMENGDRFFVGIALAARACSAMNKMGDFMGDFLAQFSKLDALLRAWTKENESLVSEAMLCHRDRGVLFLIVQKSEEFDPEVSERLTALDLQVAIDPDLNLIELNVLAVPPSSREARDAFLVVPPDRVRSYA